MNKTVDQIVSPAVGTIGELGDNAIQKNYKHVRKAIPVLKNKWPAEEYRTERRFHFLSVAENVAIVAAERRNSNSNNNNKILYCGGR